MTFGRRRLLLLVPALSLLVADQAALAQALGQPDTPGIGQFFSDPAGWLTAVFSAALLSLGHSTTAQVVGFMNWVLGTTNVISQTPPGLSYDSEVVRRLWGSMRIVGNAALAVVTIFGGINIMVHPHIRAPYHGALELVPRLVLGGLLVNTSLDWGRFVIDLNNALCSAVGTTSIPGWNVLGQADAGSVLLNLIAIVIYLLMGLLLLTQMLMRLALVDALLILAPLALLCWVLPQTQSWARLWFETFFGAVFVQFVQVLVLQLGVELIKHLTELLPSVATNPLDGSRAWLMTLLLGVSVLQLARKIPRLMPGYPGAVDTLGPIRNLVNRQLGQALGRGKGRG